MAPPGAEPIRWIPSRVQGCGEILALVRDGRARTIGDLAEAMDMARSTVMQRVDLLVADGLLMADRAQVANGRGRPAVTLRFNAEGGTVLVAQVGMTGSRVAAADLDGKLLAQDFDVSPIEAGPMTVRQRLAAALDRMLVAAGRERSTVRGVGIGWPASMELGARDDTGPGWEPGSIVSGLGAEFGAPVFLDDDVNLLALGEHHAGWRDTEVLLCIKVGTVIGCGTVIGGEIVRGAQHVAGWIGHLPVPGDSTPCRCGNVGCLDAVASGGALLRKARQAGLHVDDLQHLVALAGAGVPEATHAIREAGRQIGKVLVYAVNLLNPGVIAFWGYLAEAESELLAGVRESVYQVALPAATHSLQLVRARVGDSAGLVGAATMVVNQVLAPSAIDELLAESLPGPEWRQQESVAASPPVDSEPVDSGQPA
jgi:predicted NBD/HSP70 family sugar kinase